MFKTYNYMKLKSLFTIVAIALFATSCEQKQTNYNENTTLIKPSQVISDDYIPIFEESGYKILTFDMQSLCSDTFSVSVKVNEYKNGKLINNDSSEEFYCTTPIAEKRLLIGFSPMQTDSIKKMIFRIGNIGYSQPLKQYPISTPYGDENVYMARPFTTTDIKEGEFIPLVMYGSYWYDEEQGCVRQCGERELLPDLSSDILSYIPHYYVIGIKVTK